ncbi:MAG TPA: TonB-dependent siderophore receptor [Vicinamibacterales bacterium]
MKRKTPGLLAPRRRRRRRGTARLFVLSAAMVASATVSERWSATLHAQEPRTASRTTGQRNFDIRAGSIDHVIIAFEQTTGLHVTLADSRLGTIQSAGVSGSFTPAAAMDRLLEGTSLRATFSGDSVRLEIRTATEFVQVSGEAAPLSSPKYTEPIRDTPQTIVVIPQAVFQDQAATSLRDALRNTPGITLTAGEGGTAPGDNLLIRGFSARNDVYIDGARDPGVVSRDTFNTEAVEVAKGPSSVTAGRGSTGGSINLVTKAASLEDMASARVSLGNADTRRTTFDVNRRLGKNVGLRLNGMWQDSGVPGRDEVTQRGWGLAPSLRIGVGTNTIVTFNYQHLQQNNIPDYGLPGTLPDLANTAGLTVKDLDFSNFYGLLARDHEKVKSDVATAAIEHRFNRTLSLRNLTRYGRNNLDRVVTPPRAASVANGGADPGFDPAVAQIRRTDTKYQYRDDRTVTNQTDFRSDFNTGAVAHSTVVGLEIANDRQPSYAVTDAFANGRPPVTDLFNPDPNQGYAAALVRTGATSTAKATSAALYAFDTVKLTDKVQVDLGIRGDRIDVDYTTVAATGAATDFGRTDTALSGRSGIVYKPLSRASLYAAFSTSFNPSYDGSFGLTLSATGANSSALPPERSHNFEVGTKWDVRSNLFATTAYFRTEKTNAKTVDASGATVLAGDQQVQGVEFGLSGNLTSRWDIFTGLSLMDGRVEESGVATEIGKRLSYVPKTSFNAWSTYRLPLSLRVGGGAQFTDGYFFNNTNALTTANAAAIESLTRYWLFSAVAIYEVNRHLNIQINGTNLANERYVDRGYTGHFIPGAGRAILVSPVLTF